MRSFKLDTKLHWTNTTGHKTLELGKWGELRNSGDFKMPPFFKFNCIKFGGWKTSNRIQVDANPNESPLAGEYLRIRTSNFDEGRALFLNNKRC